MDVVLGVALASSAPATIHTVLVCGEHGDGVTLEQHRFYVPTDFAGVDAVIATILQARDVAGTMGHRMVSTGVTVTDPADAATLSSKLAGAGLDDVAVLSPALAAASMACEAGQQTGRDRMALLSVEPGTATLAVVDCADGSVTRLFRQPLADGDASAADTVADRLTMSEVHTDDLLLVSSGADATALAPRLEATALNVMSTPGEPQAALARGAALASARIAWPADVSTSALAYTQEPDSAARYYDIPGAVPGFDADELAYSAVPDDDADPATDAIHPVGPPTRRPLLVAGTALASAGFAAASALMVSMALDITPNLVALRPEFGRVLPIPAAPQKLPEPALQPYIGQPPAPSQPDVLPLPPVEIPSAPVSIPMPPADEPVPAFGPQRHVPPPAAPVASPFTFSPAPPPVPVRHSA